MAKGLFECLHEANLGQYIEQFRLHGVQTLETLATLTLQEYVKFGITSAEDRKRLFHLIRIVKGVLEERRMSTMEISVQDKENTPVKINGSGHYGHSKSVKDVSDQSTIPSSFTIQWTPRKKGRNYTDDSVKQNLVQSVEHGSKEDGLHLISGMQPDTLKRLEDQGGILFVQTSPFQPQMSPSNWKHDLRQSLSDSEIPDDLHVLDSSTNPADVTGFGAPKLKKAVMEVIDHKTKGYNYGIPGQNVITPATCRKQAKTNLDTSKIKVCVRKRPLLRKEIGSKEKDIIGIEGQSTVVLNESKVAVDLTQFTQVHKYHFDEVFDDTCSNLEVYKRTAKPLVPYVFKRAKATCFAYGQTGAGKTYTMLGNKETKGLYLLAAEDIFSLLDEDKTGVRLSVWVSYFEIYCGQLFDLLNQRNRLHAREDSRHNVCIAGLNEVQVSGPQGLIRVVEQGNRLRSTGSSGVNADSSRSHAILQIELQDAGRRKLGRFSFIDLAGSERACDTTDPSKVSRFEGAEINTSLLALKECIRALDQDHRHTPFRQSKLTQVLKDSFVGQSRTCMIANIAPCASASEHTLNTLRYADRVKELRKQVPANNSQSTPHLSAPTTFSPGNTSTPVKPVKLPLTTRQPTSTSTPIKGKTQRSRSSENDKSKHVVSKRKTVKDKSPLRKTPTRKTRNLDKSNRSSDLNCSKSVKNDSQRERKMMPNSRKDELKRRSTPPRKEVKDTPSKKGTKTKDTPSKRSEEAKNQAREAFLMNTSLPVWEPPREMELIQKSPGDVTLSPSAWEIENPRFQTKKSDSMQEEEKNASLQQSVKEVADSNMEQRGNVEENNNNSTQNIDSEVVVSSEERKNQLNSCPEVKKFETSFNSDSTLELLAEIDHALRTSLVSPLLDESPTSAQPSGLSSSNRPSDARNDKVGLSDEIRFQHPPNTTKRYDNVSRNADARLNQPQKTPVAVITGVKSPDPKKTFKRSQSLPSQTEHPNQSQVEPHHSRTPGLRSRLSGRGIQTLPSAHDLQQVSSTRDKEKARQSLFQDPHNDSNTSINRPQKSLDTENSSGVIVSTSFAEYLTSHGISIPDIIVSPDKKSPPRGKSNINASFDGRRTGVHNLHQRESQNRPDYTLASGNIKYTSFGGTHRQSNVHDKQSPMPSENQTPNSIETINQRNSFVQSSTSVNPRQVIQYREKSGIPVALTSPRSINRSVQPDLLRGRQVSENRSHVAQPTPIGQNQDSNANNSANPTFSGPKMQYNHHHARLGDGDRTQSPILVEVLRHSTTSTARVENSTHIAHVVQPNQHSIPRAFTKESLGRSGVYPSYQTSVQSPIMKETLHNDNQEPSNKETLVRRLSYQELSEHVESATDDGSLKTQSLQINLAGTQVTHNDVSAELDLAKDRLSGVVHQNTAIRRAKNLLLSAHAEQVDEIQQLCEKEMMLIAQFKEGEKDLPEYLDYVEDLLRSKLRCIDTFRDQLDSFATHTPEASPRCSMEAW